MTEREHDAYVVAVLSALLTLEATDRHLAAAIGAITFGRQRLAALTAMRERLVEEAATLASFIHASEMAEQLAARRDREAGAR